MDSSKAAYTSQKEQKYLGSLLIPSCQADGGDRNDIRLSVSQFLVHSISPELFERIFIKLHRECEQII